MSGELAHVATATRWRPAPVIAASMGLHVAAAGLAAARPELWPWALATLAANHGGLTVLGMLPRSALLGANIRRLPPASVRRQEIALTFDDGPDPEITPQVLDLLDAHGAKGTFFCIAAKAARHPAVVREIAARGHAVENHSCRHPATFALLGMAAMRREISAAQALLGELCGRPPRFFRPPAGLRSPLLDPVLHGLGLRLVSWTRRGYDTRRAHAPRVADRLLAGLSPGDILLLHDGNSAPTPAGVPAVLEALPRVLQAARASGLKPVALRQAVDG